MTAEATLPYSPPDTVLRVAGTPAARRSPALRLVAGVRTDAPRAPFVAVVVSLLVAGLLGLLVLNTVLAKDAFALHTITQDGRALADREQTLSREVEDLRSPQALAAKAAELGMVQAGPPAFLRLPDGAILGAATAALPPGAVLGPDGQVVLPPPAPEPGTTAGRNSTGEPDGTGGADSADSADKPDGTDSPGGADRPGSRDGTDSPASTDAGRDTGTDETSTGDDR